MFSGDFLITLLPKMCGYPPEEIRPAVELPVPEEAFLREVACAVRALHAGSVPGAVKDVQEEPVQDGPLAASALDHHGWGPGFEANLAGRNGCTSGLPSQWVVGVVYPKNSGRGGSSLL